MQFSTTLLCAMAAAGARAQGPTHRRFSFDFGWRFHLGPMANDSAPCDIIVGRDIGTGYFELSMKASADACCAACASVTSCAAWDWMSVPPFTCFLKNNTAGNVSRSGRATGLAPPRTPDPVAPNFDDSTWARVDLPHDYAINGTFLPTEDANHAYLPKPPSWYRKNFTLDHSLRGGTLFLLCDGAIRNARVWLNGAPIVSTPFESGYLPFGFDITAAAVWGADNVLALATDSSSDGEGTWWYEGAGLVRHWWLHFSPSPTLTIPLLRGGVFVRANVTGNISADGTVGDVVEVDVTTRVANSGAAAAGVLVTATLLDAGGALVGAATATLPSIAAGGEAAATSRITLPAASLWSPDHPVLYTCAVAVTLLEGGAPADDMAVRFGVRRVVFDADRGLVLNGASVKIKGFCQHEDLAGLGAAIPRNIHSYRVAQLKAAGANGWRASHGPLSPELLDELDAQGVLVMAENRDANDADALAAMVTRDRNHPSIIMWSLCNEVACMDSTAGRPLVDLVHELDPTRPATAALLGGNTGPGPGALAHALDLIGINYADSSYDTVHSDYSTKPIFASETSRCMIVRGVYAPLQNYSTIQSGDDCLREYWLAVSTRPYMAGLFIWVSSDFMGEPKPVFFPQVSAIKGALADAVLLPKDTLWQYRAWWTAAPVLHLLPHWSWEPGAAVTVWAYTNAAAVELFLNGISQGRQPVPPLGRPQGWPLVFTPGNLTAVGFDAAGASVSLDTIVTAGPAAALTLVMENGPALVADGADTAIVTVAVVDARGSVIPTASLSVFFAIAPGSAGVLAGVHDGDPLSHEAHQGTAHRVWMGLGRAWLRAGLEAGFINLTATADGLAPATLVVPVRG